VFGIEKVGVEGYWKKKTIANGLRPSPMAYWKWVSIYWNHWSEGIESELEEREDEEVQHVESLVHMEKVVTLGMFWLAAWIFIFLIIWTQLFQCK